MDKPNKIELTKITNEAFKRYILDLMKTRNLRQCDIYNKCGLTAQFMSNKLNGYSNNYVTLPTVYLIASNFDFDFSILKYCKAE